MPNDSVSSYWNEGEDLISRYPIHKACRDGDAVVLGQLLRSVQSFNDILEEDKFYGWAPIHWACYFGKIDCLNTLLQFGVSVNLCTKRFEQIPCHIAAFGGHPQCVVDLLKSGANFQAKDYLGESALHKAARVGNSECLTVLLKSGSKASQCNSNGHTPCDLARIQNFYACVELLEAAQQNEIAEAGYLNGNSGATCNGNNTNGKRYSNGNGIINNKRPMVDNSIPNFAFKRVKSYNTNGVSMDCEMEITPTNNHETNGKTHCNGNEIGRANSPGMDMHINNSEDMQMWSYENGFGDTAESMPDTTTNGLCFRNRQQKQEYFEQVKMKGTESHGWH